MYRDAEAIADLAIVIISTNEAHWLERCLPTVYEHAGDATLDVIVVDNSSTDNTRELVESEFPRARVVSSLNRGFGYGNNRGLERATARYQLLLNPDTEIVEGTFGELVQIMDASPAVGLAGVRQCTADGGLSPTIRRFPNAARALGEALFSERWPLHPSWSGERVLDMSVYERQRECDWTSGSFMLVRADALRSAGMLDERFFIYSEEPDLCMRIKRGGWKVMHLPQMTIIHHVGKGGVRPRMVAQDAYSRKQYAEKHFGRPHRSAYLSAVGLRHLLRVTLSFADRSHGNDRREAGRRALRTLLGREQPPFGQPPETAIAPPPREPSQAATPAPSEPEPEGAYGGAPTPAGAPPPPR
ncbi:MAG TPA: glycosyltransferase family 2 protein [Solirubrobacteraceae bacterium]|nr:glycosyltransferase family 2 protein [Solirubrobacteraceae bacterium]